MMLDHASNAMVGWDVFWMKVPSGCEECLMGGGLL